MKRMILLLMLFGFVFASGDHIEEGKELYGSNVSCSKLTDDELELIGDYMMELMHPGEQHEVMDRMMGGEGSESLRQAHVNMARRFYCGDATGMIGGSMMGSGMMFGNYGGMGYYPTGFGIIDVLIIILLVGLIILVYVYIWKGLKRR